MDGIICALMTISENIVAALPNYLRNWRLLSTGAWRRHPWDFVDDNGEGVSIIHAWHKREDRCTTIVLIGDDMIIKAEYNPAKFGAMTVKVLDDDLFVQIWPPYPDSDDDPIDERGTSDDILLKYLVAITTW